MSNIVRIYRESKGPLEFATEYLAYLSKLMAEIDKEAITLFMGELEKARQRGNIIFFAGNGGSACTASHMASDIGLDVMKKSGTNQPFRVIALTDSVSALTAIGNDNGYENVFVYQLRMLYQPGDVLAVISASGNSPNVVAAVEWVKTQGGRALGMVGFDGGRLKEICDVVIHVQTPKGEYGPVEDMHMIMDHLIANYLHYKMAEEREE